jgi:hypothetical protein
MLGMKKYPKDYVTACRARVEADLRAYRKHAGKAGEEFEVRFFNNQVQLLDHMFVHRLAGVEGKDGNPLNEVRVLCNSILLNNGKFQVDKLPGWPESAGSGIKLSPETSILKLRTGDEIKVREADFVRLSDAFFREIEKKYGA